MHCCPQCSCVKRPLCFSRSVRCSGTAKLHQAHALLSETEDVGITVIDSMQQQREQILRTTSTVRHTVREHSLASALFCHWKLCSSPLAGCQRQLPDRHGKDHCHRHSTAGHHKRLHFGCVPSSPPSLEYLTHGCSVRTPDLTPCAGFAIVLLLAMIGIVVYFGYIKN